MKDKKISLEKTLIGVAGVSFLTFAGLTTNQDFFEKYFQHDYLVAAVALSGIGFIAGTYLFAIKYNKRKEDEKR